ncbi:hypothetical protein Tco_0608017, partial [Tanacetum coccineum]
MVATVAVMTHLIPLHVRLAPVVEAEKPQGEAGEAAEMEEGRFEFNDKGTMLHLGKNSARWSNLVGKLVREFPMYYPSWHKIKEEKKVHIIGRLMAQWDTQIDYWLDLKHAARAAQNAQNRVKSKVFCRQESRALVVLRDQQMESSATREYPSLISTFFDTHTYDGVLAHDEAHVQYEEMLRLRDLGANTPSGVPYTEEEIMAMVRKGKQGRHIPRVGRVLAEKGKTTIFIEEPRSTYTNTEIDEIKEEAKRTRRELDLLRRVISSDDRISQMLTQLESQIEIGGVRESRSGRDGNDEQGGDEDASRDEDAGGDEDIRTFYIW